MDEGVPSNYRYEFAFAFDFDYTKPSKRLSCLCLYWVRDRLETKVEPIWRSLVRLSKENPTSGGAFRFLRSHLVPLLG